MNNDSGTTSIAQAMREIELLKEQLSNKNRRIEQLEQMLAARSKAPVQGRAGRATQQSLGSLWSLKRLARERRAVSEIRHSGLFDAEFYLTQFEARDDYAQAKRSPIKHFLNVGAYEGLNPCETFESEWYLATNFDVAAAGLNPLLHYIEHGQQEGRLPNFWAKYDATDSEPVTASDHNRRLWSGFAHLALPDLELQADTHSKKTAAWYLAAWCYAHGDLESAVQRIRQIESLTSAPLKRRELVGLLKCLTLLGDEVQMNEVLEDPRTESVLGNIYPYIKSNLARLSEEDDDALLAMNSMFYRVGLDGIARVDDDRPLALNNLKGRSDMAAPASIDGPLISVVIPAYNAEDTLPIALEGLLGQTWRNLDIVVVDDGSSDGTVAVAQGYAQRDSRVRCLPNDFNQGAYPTRNNGMRQAKGDFVTVHDSDDWSHPQKLERQALPLLNDSTKVASYSHWVRVTEDMRFVGPWLLSGGFVEKNHSSLLMRRSLLDEVGYWDEVNVAGDTEFLWRLEARFGHRSIVPILTNTPLSFALADDTSLTRTKATHVKTIHYGLRRVYREAARWWHQSQGESVSMLDPQDRSFPIPIGIARGTETQVDAVVVANWALPDEDLRVHLDTVKELHEQGLKLALFHWPEYLKRQDASISDGVFELCSELGISFAHMGLTVETPKIYVLNPSLWSYPPTQAFKAEGLNAVVGADGQRLENEVAMLEYFSQGGV